MQSKKQRLNNDAQSMSTFDFTVRYTLFARSEASELTRDATAKLDKVLSKLPAEQRAAIKIAVADCISYANGDGWSEHFNSALPIIRELRQQVADLTQPQMLAA